MADFAAVLKKTLEKMGETTPEIREKVYEKARETVKRQIAAMEKQPPQAAIDRQFAKLEDAISGVEAEYAPAVDDLGLEAILDEVVPEVVEPAPESVAAEPEPAVDPEPEPAPEPVAETEPATSIEPEPVAEVPPAEEKPALEPNTELVSEIKARAKANAARMEQEAAAVAAETSAAASTGDPLSDFLNDELSATKSAAASVENAAGDLKDLTAQKSGDTLGSVDDLVAGAPGAMTMPKQKSGFGALLKILVVLGLLGGVGYYASENREDLNAMWMDKVVPWWQNLTSGSDATDDDAASSDDDDGVPVRTVTTTTVENNGSEEATAAEDVEAPAQPEVADVSEAEPTVKFTQRLTEDGTEVDDGPAQGAEATPEAGEGSSVAPQTAGTAQDEPADEVAESTAEPAEENAEAETPEAAPAPTVEPSTATPVGQRAIFYEERTGSQEGTALAGATIWSVVNEEPGGDLPVEPAIRAETSIPELGINMEMTIRRNGDKTFPASHIIELFFRVPDTFEGRGIADVQRITFKTNEQDPGNALIAVPAPLDQNIFLIALTDAATAIETNVQLMRRENWIDIPMQYTSGRRALITFEKGIPGERVFEEVFTAWEAAPIN